MTTPAQPDPADRWPELLAAYADGELDPETRARVERWLAEHPEALEQLRAQRELSPENWRLWQNAEPPVPSEEAWSEVRRTVDEETRERPVPAPQPAPRRHRAAWWVAGGVAAAVAVLVGWWATLKPNPPPGPGRSQPEVVNPVPHDAPAVEVAALPVATDDDVELLRVPGGDLSWLVVGSHPLPDMLVLAGPDDVELLDLDPDEWPDGGPKMITAPGDAPMIFAAKAR
jgi:hypothetical protein